MKEKTGGDQDIVELRLYVAGDEANSQHAVANLQEICRRYLPGRHNLEIVDVLAEPSRALQDGIILTPTLVRLSPPRVRILGNLSERDKVLNALRLRILKNLNGR